MANRFIKNDEGETILVNEGDFGTLTVTGRTGAGSTEVEATVIAVNRHGEVEVLFGDGGMYPSERSWVRVGDGKCEHSRHRVVGADLERLESIYEANRPVATGATLGSKT